MILMRAPQGSILDFLQGNSNKFFKASALEQKSMLLEWAKMVGIYDEDRAGKGIYCRCPKRGAIGKIMKYCLI